MGLVPSAQLSPEWLYYFMSSVDLTELQAGTSVPAVKQSKVEELAIPVPPLPEQRRLVGYLDGLAGQVAALARLQSETAAELDALLPSLLDKAFKGEL
jgi:type I restriction enzyme S subunit